MKFEIIRTENNAKKREKMTTPRCTFAKALLAAALIVSFNAVFAQGDQSKGFSERLAELLPGMGGDDLAEREKAQQAFQTMCWRAGRPGAEDEREAVCKAILPALGAETPKAAREWLIRQLRYIGRAESAEALAALLEDSDLEIREHARMALQGNPSDKAGEVLCVALDKAAEPEFKAALINALAGRSDQATLDALLKHALAEEDAVRTAAIRALALAGDMRAADAIKSAAAKGDERAKASIMDSQLLLADKLCAEGKTEAGEKIYRDVLAGKGPARGAAFIGLVRAGGAGAVAKISAELGEAAAEDRCLFEAMMGNLDKLPADFSFRLITRRLDLAQGPEKAALFKVLAANTGALAIPSLLTGLENEDMEVRVAALESLGMAGDESVLTVLAEAAGSVERAEKESARTALARVKGEKVEPAMLELVRDTGEAPEIRCEIIRALAARRAAGAGPAMLEAAADKNLEVRMAALRGMGDVAGESDAAAIVELVKNAGNDDERAEAITALMAVCRRDESGKTAELFLAEMEKAGKAPRVAMIKGLGGLGGDKALAAAKQALAGGDADEQDAAIRALIEWRDAAPIEELLTIATDGKDDVHRVLALGGYIRMVAMLEDVSNADACAMYENAWDLAERDEERRLIMAQIPKKPDLQALKFMERVFEEMNLLGEDAVLPEVETAYVETAIALAKTNPKEAKAALQQFCGSSKNENLVKRAVETIQTLE